jgi:16S rRNA (guanine1516-N2)-methyltransferase
MSTIDLHTPLLNADPALQRHARALVRQFGFELVTTPPPDSYYLYLNADSLELQHSGPPSAGPIRVDFIGGVLGHRRRFGGGRNQPLARAVGMKPGVSPTVWDATAGLGRDGFVLASLGCRVTLCERSATLAALLQDALARAAADEDIGDWVRRRLCLIHGDSSKLLQVLSREQQPEVVYLDPMYPPGKETVLVKKEMRALRHLVGPDQGSDVLLEIAQRATRRRVVVKRPKRAGWLHNKRPDTCIESKKTRYDIYLTF